MKGCHFSSVITTTSLIRSTTLQRSNQREKNAQPQNCVSDAIASSNCLQKGFQKWQKEGRKWLWKLEKEIINLERQQQQHQSKVISPNAIFQGPKSSFGRTKKKGKKPIYMQKVIKHHNNNCCCCTWRIYEFFFAFTTKCNTLRVFFFLVIFYICI